MRKKIFSIVQIGKDSDITSRVFDYFITITILVNIIVLYAGTFRADPMYKRIELVCTVIYMTEYILRLITADYLYEQDPKRKSSPFLYYILSFDGLVLLLCSLSLWLPPGFVVLRLFRVMRILHIFQFNDGYDAYTMVADVLYSKKMQLCSSLVLVGMLALFSSFLMYTFEHEAQPEVFANAFSGIWWAISTLLTVGYGDIYPITAAGRVCAIIIALMGVCMVAIPTGIISAGFVEMYQEARRLAIDEPDEYFSGIDIHKGHKWEGKKVKEIRAAGGGSVAAILRDKMVLDPGPEFIISVGDRILLGKKV